MKKTVLLLAAAVASAFTSCVSDDDSYKELQPVLPGINIYQSTWTQLRIAMAPADAAIRAAMLFAEADVQGKTDFHEVTLNGIPVFNRLFDGTWEITREEYGYRIESHAETVGASGLAFSGALRITTGGVALLADTDDAHAWAVTPEEDFQLILRSTTGEEPIRFTGGAIRIWHSGAENYVIDLQSIAAQVVRAERPGCNWSGSFTLEVPEQSLAFSKCTGNEFELEGSAAGPSCLTFDGKSATQLGCQLTDCLFGNSATGIYGGTALCRLTGSGDYPTDYYPATDVTVDWVLAVDGKTLTQQITYNGTSVIL